MNNKIIKQVGLWLFAFAAAYIIVNATLVIYYHYTPGFPLEVNATNEIYYPNSGFLNSMEGHGWGKFDANGYNNPDKKVDYEEYVLIMGASHTMGKEVAPGKNYCELLDDVYGINTYNMAMDAHYYDDIVDGFSAALEQFDKSTAVVIETSVTDFNLSDLEKTVNQRVYDERLSGKEILNYQSKINILKRQLQTWLPYRKLLNQKIKTFYKKPRVCEIGEIDDYENALYDSMMLMKSKYKKPIIILYHPNIGIGKNGDIEFYEDESTKRAFINACNMSDIVLIDMSNDFATEYEMSNKLPYGFMNTIMGEGHLNETGHKLIARRLAEEIKNIKN